MAKKTTEELDHILGQTHPKDAEKYLQENAESLCMQEKPFECFIKDKLKEKRMKQQDVFIQADIPERYGYRLLSEEKRTKQRDVILRICYAAGLSLEEVQHALMLYGMAPLYAKIPRDSVLMIAFNMRPGDVLEVNALLKENGFDMLRTSGNQE